MNRQQRRLQERKLNKIKKIYSIDDSNYLLVNYLKNYIKTNWKNLIDEFNEFYDSEIQDQDFIILHFKTFPQNDIYFKKFPGKIEFLTFCLIKEKSYLDSIFIFVTNRSEGIYELIGKN